MTTTTAAALSLNKLCALARRAGDEIMEIYAQDFSVERKGDDSPVTEADQRAEAVILAGLAELAPDIPAVAEEAMAAGARPDISGGRFWLVDPLDGTKEFISRNGEFTVNIALIEQGRPVLGVVFAPALGRLFAGANGAAFAEDGQGRRGISVRAVPPEGLTVVGSRSHGDPQAMERFLAGRPVARQVAAGSSLKFCLLAAGEADLYPRFGPTMEWDTAAGHAVLAAAGGTVVELGGAPLLYGKDGFRNPHFVACGKA
ncbi:3'(2'),5'-bisphosphate nucleotidase CysQ [Telmatospirillum sp. J64-1]|uniref:3'(2'),5'-bisphosphate nucleotidase CysQ n=1 Tax=Telmatospirillum sp. J64-1 TaxID=2502183 RepID=UPI00115E28C4|nr:3'(2'),5'-bisphosphate nucleotidase CysQ [Telmatospirillum sp. J64-1]